MEIRCGERPSHQQPCPDFHWIASRCRRTCCHRTNHLDDAKFLRFEILQYLLSLKVALMYTGTSLFRVMYVISKWIQY